MNKLIAIATSAEVALFTPFPPGLVSQKLMQRAARVLSDASNLSSPALTWKYCIEMAELVTDDDGRRRGTAYARLSLIASGEFREIHDIALNCRENRVPYQKQQDSDLEFLSCDVQCVLFK